MQALNLNDQRSTPYFSDEHEMLRDTIRNYVEKSIMPVAHEWESKGFIPREIVKEMGSLGLLGIRYQSEYGGSDLDTLATVILAEELGRSTFGGFAITILVHTDMASPHLFNFGNKAQLDKYMPDVIAGNKVCAVAMTEPDAGSDLASMRTTARREGDHYVINGAKTFITNGVHGDIYFVAAKTGNSGRGHSDISMFIIEAGTPGFTVERQLDKHGWLSSDTAELSFVDCKVPVENLLGEENKGFYSLVKNLQNERIVMGGQAIGEASKAMEITMEWLQQRKTFGTTLWEKQAIRHRMAELETKITAASHFLYNTAWRDTMGQRLNKEVSMIKALCGELVNEVMYSCMQFHGGMGYMRESTIERMVRDARVQNIGGGTTEIMLEEIAKRMG